MIDFESKRLLMEAERLIPGGVNSPVRAFKAVDETPRFIKSAFGAYLKDVDGQDYIDYVGSWGPMILGHAHPAVIEAVKKTSELGLSFGAPSPLEIELATEICKKLPSIEQIRFVNSGTEASMSAIRLARAVTHREKIIKFAGCYHGHADCLLVEAGSGSLTFGQPSSPGVPKATAADTLVAQFNQIDTVTALFENNPKDIAAIIVEPIPGNMNLIFPKPLFLLALQELCKTYGALLIFDEVMTGFRVGLEGAQGLYQITPDLTILGKIIGGGMPVGAFGGRREYMQQLSPQGKVYQAGTLSGNPLAMAAGIATLKQLKPESYSQLNRSAEKLCQGMNQLANTLKVPFFAQFCGGMFGFFFTDKHSIEFYDEVKNCNETLFKVFYRYLLKQGIYFAPSRFETNFLSLAHHDKEINQTLEAIDKAFHFLNKERN